jgi:archaetidylinositol phosphate synthase
MVLDRTRKQAEPLLNWFAKRLSFLSPDTLTWLALVCAVVAGVLFFVSNPTNEQGSYFLLLASLFVLLNGLFDAIDGKVAKLTNRATAKGDFLDHALDRYADVLIIGGLALSAWCRPSIGLLAIVGVLLTSYMGTQAQAVGYTRDYSGLLGRADRLALLMVFPVIQHAVLPLSYQLPWGTTVLEWVLIYFAVVGNITAVQRFYSTLRSFHKKQ